MKKILSMLVALSIGTFNYAMDNNAKQKKSSIQPIHPKVTRKKTPFKKLSYPSDFAQFINNQTKSIKYYGGKKYNGLFNKPDTYEEVIDLRTKAAIVNDTFYNLIKESIKAKRPYFLAAILVCEKIKDTRTNQTIERIARHYHDAAYLIKWLFNDYFIREANKKDPITNQTILVPIIFFKVTKLQGSIKYFASEFDLKQNTQTAQYMCALLKSSLEIPKDIHHLACAYHSALGTSQDLEKAKIYYKKCRDQGYIEGINGIGNVYLEQKQYPKAEKHFLLAADNMDVEAQLNLIYLFAINKSTRSFDEVIIRFFKAQEDIDSMNNYAHMYPCRWEIIKQYMTNQGIEIPDITNQQDDNTNENNNENEEANVEMESYGHIFLPDEEAPIQPPSTDETIPLLDTPANTALSQDQEQNESIPWPQLNQTEQEQLNSLVAQTPEQNNETLQNYTNMELSDSSHIDLENEWEDVDNQLENLQNTVNDTTKNSSD